MPNADLGVKIEGKSFGWLPGAVKILRNRAKCGTFLVWENRNHDRAQL
jgi:hypothetical protein